MRKEKVRTDLITWNFCLMLNLIVTPVTGSVHYSLEGTDALKELEE